MNDSRASSTASVCVQALSVELRREYTRVRSLREYVIGSLKGWIRDAQWFEALSDVSFSVAPGELFAVLGPNGAGKTTLLRVLAGIIPPTRGSVRVEGRTAPLIELGAGFDPELTGHENVFLYGSLLGMSRQALRDGLTEIVEFSGLDSVMEVAVKNYSSGMIGRLGFAVATAARPRVLLVDEVLAVGDEQFRSQCFARIDSLLEAGTAVVLVSHDLALVGHLAKRGLLLDSSRVVACGDLDEVIEVYRRRVGE